MEKADADNCLEMFYYKGEQRRGNGVKKEIKMSNIQST